MFLAALGMMAGLSATDVAQLKEWHDVATPSFVGLMMAHFGAVVTAFIAGKLIPTERDPDLRTRDSDRNPQQPTVVVATIPSQPTTPTSQEPKHD